MSAPKFNVIRKLRRHSRITIIPFFKLLIVIVLIFAFMFSVPVVGNVHPDFRPDFRTGVNHELELLPVTVNPLITPFADHRTTAQVSSRRSASPETGVSFSSFISEKPIYDESTYHGSTVDQESSTNFISRWNTSITMSSNSIPSNSNQIILPLVSSGIYNFTVDWGDGSADTIISYSQTETTHTYASEGIYDVIINGTLKGWNFNSGISGDAKKIIEISQWGDLNFGNSSKYFYGAENLVLIATDAPDLNGTTTLTEAFYDCHNLGHVGSMNTWDTSSVTDMSWIFYEASSFNQAIGNWNTSSVIKMNRMFTRAPSFNQSLDSWDVSNVNRMDWMFAGASSFNQPLDNWDVSNVNRMDWMFAGASSFNQPLDNWNTSSVTNMALMFNEASSFNQPLDNWNISSTGNLYGMFWGASSFNQPLNNWDVSSVFAMGGMFAGASSFNQPLDNWNTSSVIYMNRMFNEASSFNLPLNNWDVSSVITMSGMFWRASSFNQPLDNWDTSSVVNMREMFRAADAFDQDLGSWDVSNVLNMGSMFFDITLSIENYDSILLGWSELELQYRVEFHAGFSTFTAAASEARNFIITTFEWRITDGGLYGFDLSPTHQPTERNPKDSEWFTISFTQLFQISVFTFIGLQVVRRRYFSNCS